MGLGAENHFRQVWEVAWRNRPTIPAAMQIPGGRAFSVAEGNRPLPAPSNMFFGEKESLAPTCAGP